MSGNTLGGLSSGNRTLNGFTATGSSATLTVGDELKLKTTSQILIGQNQGAVGQVITRAGDGIVWQAQSDTKGVGIINQDIPFLIYKDNKKINFEIKKYKQNNIFRNLIIHWPQIYGTSSITVKKNILENFLNKSEPYKWKYLAIDVQLILFCSINFKIYNQLNQITFKRKHDRNLGDMYLNIFSKIFWKRRKCQHDFYYFIKKKRVYNLDYFITWMINIFL